ncbi:hypothetical protein [Kaarinaea lacus]
MAAEDLTKEQRILRMCRHVLTDVAKDTVTPAGMKHPLSENTIQGIRDCLQLISSREAEILAEQGKSSTLKPRFIDEPQKNVVVELTPKKSTDKKSDE